MPLQDTSVYTSECTFEDIKIGTRENFVWMQLDYAIRE